MRRVTGLIAAGLALLTASCSSEPEDASSAPVNQAASNIQPRAVVQFGHSAPIDAIAWANDEQNLVSFDRSGEILIWDVESRSILDRAKLDLRQEWLSLYVMEVQDDPGKVAFVFGFIDREESMAPGVLADCPEAALRENLWCTLTFDLETREVTPDQTIAIPGQPWLETPSSGLEWGTHEASPSGRWKPEIFRAVDRPDLSNPDARIVHVPELDEFPGYQCASSDRCDYGILLNPLLEGDEPVALVGQSRIYVNDLDISSDGHSIVQINSYHTSVRSWSWVRSTDLLRLKEENAFENEHEYQTVSWFDDRSFLMLGRGFADHGDRNSDELETGNAMRYLTYEQEEELYESYETRDRDPFPPARLVGRNCLLTDSCHSAPSYYAMELLNERGDYIGSGNLADCEVELGATYCERIEVEGTPISPEIADRNMSDGISRFDASSGHWMRFSQPDWGGEEIRALRLSPDKTRLAVLTREGRPESDEYPTLRLRQFEIAGDRLQPIGPVIFEKAYDETDGYGDITSNGGNVVDPSPQLRFTPDGNRIVFSHYMRTAIDTEPDVYELVVVNIDGNGSAQHFNGHSQNFIMLDSKRVFGVESGKIFDLDNGETLAIVPDRPEMLNAGLIEASNLIWGAGVDGRIQYWDATSGSLVLSLFMLPENRFFAMTPGGRYDSNLPPESDAVRWVVPDDPWRSLAPQTFMRDFYEPSLYSKLLDCRAQDNCTSVFRPLPSLDQVNRTLPRVEIVDVQFTGNPAEVEVTVEASGSDGGATSGLYNLRLFRNGRLVAMTPNVKEEIASGASSWQDTVLRWRRFNNLGDGETYRTSFTVPLSTGAGAERQVFTAYAFNEDRIKSETAVFEFFYDRDRREMRQPKAYVINIGIDAYEATDLQLNYAVSDAELLAMQLARIPGYETRQLSLLASRRSGEAGGARITRQTILNVLQLLAGNVGRSDVLEVLQRDGVDASILEPATPDDLVIISFSGHGWTDSIGNFFLIPANGRPGGGGADLDLLVSAADLSHALRTNQAGEIALITDACFSSAIVQNNAFKPGPLGDAGLGQLAYDKGIYILAASQADNYAVEDMRLSHGLLTFTLAGRGEGLDLPGNGDADRDGRIRLDEWLTYAETRLPSLSADLEIGRFNSRRGAVEAIDAETMEEDYIQRPTLFNFNERASPVMLRPN